MTDLRSSLQAALGERYRLVRELTGGGMSRVYLAEDRDLQRDVVVKVLSPELLGPEHLGRFRQEVLQTARLQHPTIVPVIAVGAVEGTGGSEIPYYVMPYVRGESLRSRLHHDGTLSVAIAVRVLRNVFDALNFAHTHGVVHRDLKPENIFLSGTSAVLADFGIAKAVSGPGSLAGVTQPGVALGTPAYMAPEQVLDAEQVGPRTDLFAAGIVAYEMLTGRLPWDVDGRPGGMMARLHGTPVPLRELRPDTPPLLAALIESCLAVNPASRPASAARALEALDQVGLTSGNQPTNEGLLALQASTLAAGTASGGRRRRWPLAAAAGLLAAAAVVGGWWWTHRVPRATVQRLAVLPPELPPGLPDGALLGEQLVHLLVAQLAPVSGLRLVGQVTVQQLTEQGLSAAQVEDSLRHQGVDSALVMVVRREDDGRLALSTALRRLGTPGRQPMGGPVRLPRGDSGSLDSLVTAMRTLAGGTVAKLALNAGDQVAVGPRRADAYVLWLQGRDQVARRTPDGFRAAIQSFERAIQLDSTYVQARTELANALSLAIFYRYRQAEGEYALAARALALADEAVEAHPEVGDGYLSRALLGTTVGAPVAYLEENFAMAERLAAGSPYLVMFRAGLLARQGRLDDALALVEEEVQLDPRSAGHRVASALYAMPARQYATMVRNGRAARSMSPDVPVVAQFELWGHLQLGGRTAPADCRGVPVGPYLGSRALCLERTGAPTEARRLVDSLHAILTGKAPADSTFDLSLSIGEMAMYSAAHGDHDAARDWIREAFAVSPGGIDFRFMRSGFFDEGLVSLADSLQAEAWRRVEGAARQRRSTP